MTANALETGARSPYAMAEIGEQIAIGKARSQSSAKDVYACDYGWDDDRFGWCLLYHSIGGCWWYGSWNETRGESLSVWG